MANFLVTGGAGFIGSSLAERLLEIGQSVRVVDDFSTGHRRNVEPFLDRIELVEGDLADLSVSQAAVQGMDYVLHQAAIPSVPRSVEDPLRIHNANANATLNMLVAARDAKVKRFVFASSSSVYGDSEVLPKVETMPANPLSPYAVTKLVGEKYGAVFHKLYGFPVVALRYFNIFGPRQDPHSPYSGAISRFIEAALRGTRPLIYGDGEQSRDFTYVENAVEANLLACKAPGVEGMVFNVGTGERHTLKELLCCLSSILGCKLEPEFANTRLGDVRHSQAGIEKARRFLLFEPRVGFQEGLERTLNWFRRSLNAGR
jgi:UDP-glucose 4-epimerase